VQQDGGNDTLRLGADVTPANLLLSVSGDDLVLELADSANDRLVIQDWFDPNRRIENFVLADGTVVGQSLVGTANADILSFGGAGFGILEGGAGQDVYHFSRGDGRNNIIRDDYSYQQTYNYVENAAPGYTVNRTGSQTVRADGGQDVLEFGAGISQNDLELRRDGNDLMVRLASIPNQAPEAIPDEIRIVDWYNQYNRIEKFRFADGNEIDPLTLEIASDLSGGLLGWSEVDIGSQATNDVVSKMAGQTQLEAGGGDDTYRFNRGDGRLDFHDQHAYQVEQSYEVPYGANQERRIETVVRSMQRDGGLDKIQLGAGIVASDLVYQLKGRDLWIGIKTPN
ncbi:MAG: calcium-binding protein, partial [Ferrovibrio sp.]